MEATAPVTVEQAAAILGVSPSTVHRRIRSGALKAEQVQRPQGTVWLVHLPADTVTAAGDLSPPTGPEATAPTGVSVGNTQADAMVSLIQTTIATVLAPLVGQIDAHRQTVERQNEQMMSQANRIAELEREAGRYAAERDAAEARYASILAAQTAATCSESEPAVPWWRGRWSLMLALMAVMLLLFVVLLAWPT